MTVQAISLIEEYRHSKTIDAVFRGFCTDVHSPQKFLREIATIVREGASGDLFLGNGSCLFLDGSADPHTGRKGSLGARLFSGNMPCAQYVDEAVWAALYRLRAFALVKEGSSREDQMQVYILNPGLRKPGHST